MQQQNDVKALVLTCLVYLVSLVSVLAWDRFMNGAITGRGLAGSILAAIVCTVWWEIRRRRIERDRLKDDQLRRRGLFHQNGGDRGEVNGGGLIVLACLVALALLAATVNYCAAAEPNEEPTMIDAALVEVSRELFPSVPLSDRELFELQWLSTRIGVLARELETAVPNMTAAVVEKRAAIKRTLKKLHAELVDLQIIQAGEALRATRKGGRP